MRRPASNKAGAPEEPTIFIVDDDALTLRVVVQTLRVAGYDVAAFEDPRTFLASAPFRRHGCAILDLSMPEISGLAVQQALSERDGTLPVLFLTGAADVRSTVTAMKGGAVDFLLKPVDPEELRAAVAGAVLVSERRRAAHLRRRGIESLLMSLTPREHEVCERLAKGMLNKQIAYDLGLSEATVKVHRAHVMEKLQVGSVAELSAMLERLRGE